MRTYEDGDPQGPPRGRVGLLTTAAEDNGARRSRSGRRSVERAERLWRVPPSCVARPRALADRSGCPLWARGCRGSARSGEAHASRVVAGRITGKGRVTRRPEVPRDVSRETTCIEARGARREARGARRGFGLHIPACRSRKRVIGRRALLADSDTLRADKGCGAGDLLRMGAGALRVSGMRRAAMLPGAGGNVVSSPITRLQPAPDSPTPHAGTRCRLIHR